MFYPPEKFVADFTLVSSTSLVVIKCAWVYVCWRTELNSCLASESMCPEIVQTYRDNRLRPIVK